MFLEEISLFFFEVNYINEIFQPIDFSLLLGKQHATDT